MQACRNYFGLDCIWTRDSRDSQNGSRGSLMVTVPQVFINPDAADVRRGRQLSEEPTQPANSQELRSAKRRLVVVRNGAR